MSQAGVAAANLVVSLLCDDRFAKGQTLASRHVKSNLTLFKASYRAKSKIKKQEVYSQHEVKT